MKTKKLLASTLALLWLTFLCACAEKNKPVNVSRGQAVAESMMGERIIRRAPRDFEPVFVFRDSMSPANRFFPTGWMGDVQDITFNDNYRADSRTGVSSIRIQYTPQGRNRWAGIYWQAPANNWGDMPGGLNLTGASELIFWMRGETGFERIAEIKIGGLSGQYPDSDVAWLKDVHLTRQWRQYRIPLKGRDLSRIAGGFAIVVSRRDNPRGAVFFIDEVRFE